MSVNWNYLRLYCVLMFVLLICLDQLDCKPLKMLTDRYQHAYSMMDGSIDHAKVTSL